MKPYKYRCAILSVRGNSAPLVAVLLVLIAFVLASAYYVWSSALLGGSTTIPSRDVGTAIKDRPRIVSAVSARSGSEYNILLVVSSDYFPKNPRVVLKTSGGTVAAVLNGALACKDGTCTVSASGSAEPGVYTVEVEDLSGRPVRYYPLILR